MQQLGVVRAAVMLATALTVLWTLPTLAPVFSRDVDVRATFTALFYGSAPMSYPSELETFFDL